MKRFAIGILFFLFWYGQPKMYAATDVPAPAATKPLPDNHELPPSSTAKRVQADEPNTDAIVEALRGKGSWEEAYHRWSQFTNYLQKNCDCLNGDGPGKPDAGCAAKQADGYENASCRVVGVDRLLFSGDRSGVDADKVLSLMKKYYDERGGNNNNMNLVLAGFSKTYAELKAEGETPVAKAVLEKRIERFSQDYGMPMSVARNFIDKFHQILGDKTLENIDYDTAKELAKYMSPYIDGMGPLGQHFAEEIAGQRPDTVIDRDLNLLMKKAAGWALNPTPARDEDVLHRLFYEELQGDESAVALNRNAFWDAVDKGDRETVLRHWGDTLPAFYDTMKRQAQFGLTQADKEQAAGVLKRLEKIEPKASVPEDLVKSAPNAPAKTSPDAVPEIPPAQQKGAEAVAAKPEAKPEPSISQAVQGIGDGAQAATEPIRAWGRVGAKITGDTLTAIEAKVGDVLRMVDAIKKANGTVKPKDPPAQQAQTGEVKYRADFWTGRPEDFDSKRDQPTTAK